MKHKPSKKKKGKGNETRIVGDYKCTLNSFSITDVLRAILKEKGD